MVVSEAGSCDFGGISLLDGISGVEASNSSEDVAGGVRKVGNGCSESSVVDGWGEFSGALGGLVESIKDGVDEGDLHVLKGSVAVINVEPGTDQVGR